MANQRCDCGTRRHIQANFALGSLSSRSGVVEAWVVQTWAVWQLGYILKQLTCASLLLLFRLARSKILWFHLHVRQSHLWLQHRHAPRAQHTLIQPHRPWYQAILNISNLHTVWFTITFWGSKPWILKTQSIEKVIAVSGRQCGQVHRVLDWDLGDLCSWLGSAIGLQSNLGQITLPL